MYRLYGLLIINLLIGQQVVAQVEEWKPLFDGNSLEGWEGNLDHFRIEGDAIVGGSMTAPLPQNEFLCSTEEYDDFVLRLNFRLVGEGTNAGIQFRSQRVADSHEVAGYQADLGSGFWGGLYDESRRNRVLAQADSAALAPFLDRDGWNDYAIYANGHRVRLFINGHVTVDYVEPDMSLDQSGRICLQIHSGPPGEAWYKDIKIKQIAYRPEEPLGPVSEAVTFEKHVITPHFISEGITTGDFDRDGDVDLLAGEYWFAAPDWEMREIRPGKNYSVHAGYSEAFLNFAVDVNGDGWLDVVQFGAPGREAHWYENPGERMGIWPGRLVHPSVGSENPLLEDIDGDGREDLLFLDREARQIVWLEPPRTQEDTTWMQHAISEPLDNSRTRRIAHGLGYDDVNGDGRSDVIAIDAWWEAPADPRSAWTEHAAELGEPAAQMHAYDVDGDGDQDMVASSAHQYGVWWYRQERADDGSISFTRSTIDDRLSQTHALAVADLDQDGLFDLITGKRFFAHNGNDPGAFEPSALVWYALGRDATGLPTWTPYLIDEDAGAGLQLLVEDVTGDGRLDIITSSKKGVYVFEHTTD